MKESSKKRVETGSGIVGSGIIFGKEDPCAGNLWYSEFQNMDTEKLTTICRITALRAGERFSGKKRRLQNNWR
jgi:hypothetical protein